MANTVQLKKDGQIVYPITDRSCIIGLEEGPVMSCRYAWDGTTTPDVTKIPAGVTVEYNSNTYTGTLTASASTVGYQYLVYNPTSTEFDRYATDATGGSYAWKPMGDTTIQSPDIADNLTTNDSTKALSAKQGVVLQGEVTELEHKVDEEIPTGLYEKQYLQPIAFELGNITISGSGWAYSSSSSRVRTPQGFVLYLFPGDKIALSDYTDARFYWGCHDLFGNYTYGGWLTADYTVEREGYYCILVSNISEQSQTSAAALGSLVQVTRNNTTSSKFDGVIPRVTTLEQNITVAKVLTFVPTVVSDLRVDIGTHKIEKVTGDKLYYLPILKGQTISGNWTFASGYVRYGLTAGLPLTKVPLITDGAGGTGTISHDFTATENGFVVVSFVGSPTSISFTMANNAIGKNVAVLEEKVEEGFGIIEKITGTGSTAISKTITVPENRRYHLRLGNFQRGSELSNYQVFVFDVGNRRICQYYGTALIPEDFFFEVGTGEGTLTFYLRQKSGEVLSLNFNEETHPPIFDYNNYSEQILRLENTSKKISGDVNPFVLLHFSDIHGDTARLTRLLGYYNILKYKMDDILHTGDAVASTVTATSFDFWDECNAQGILNLIGNHDVWYTNDFTPGVNYPYNTYIKPYVDGEYWGTIVQPQNAEENGLCYYYKDYMEKKIRLIVLDYQYSSGQITWLNGVLSDAITNQLSVVIAVHYIPKPFTKGYDSAFNVSQFVSEGATLDPAFVDAVDSFVGNGGEFVCWLTGHTHKDFSGYWQGTNGKQVIISIDCASLRNDSSTRYRGENSKSQDAFNIFSVNINTKLITIWRVGNDCDALQRHIGSMSIKYDTAELISSD